MTFTPTTYAEKLRDPRWQKRRLEIMQRDDFACCVCGSETETLNVHHRWYGLKREPWDYPDSSLVTLCEECHAVANERDRAGREELLAMICDCGVEFDEVGALVRTISDKGLTVADAAFVLAGSKRNAAKRLVESLVLDASLRDYCAKTAPGFDAETELADFKLRMRANGYKVGKVPVADARAAFQYHMRNAVKFSARNTGTMRPVAKVRPVADRKEL